MAHLVSKPAKFDLLHLQVLTGVWEYKGDVQVTGFHEPLGGNEPFIKSVLTRGSCRMEYPGTDYPDVIESTPNCRIFPAQNAVGKQLFRMTTLEDNMEVQCIHPYVGYRVTTVSDGSLEAGGTMPIAKGVLVLVFGDAYTINGDEQVGFRMFAVQNNDIAVVANSTCRVIVFKSIPV
jgi:hypothetical protein